MITPGQTFTGKVGVPFAATPSAAGPVALWRAERLPVGLSLNPTTGNITGTPERTGIFTAIFSDKPFAKGVLNGGYFGSYHAIKSDGTLVGWGSDSTGSFVPSGLSDVVEISRDLALKKDGTVVAIGYGVAPSGLTDVAALGLNLVLKKDGTLFAWGDNTHGQTNVPAGSDYIAIASGNRWHVALRSNGTVVGWGQPNSGLLNTSDITGVKAIAAGSNFFLTLHEDGTVFSRAGSNNLDDIWSYGSDPTLPKAIAIAAGINRSLVLLEDGRVYRYGDVGHPSTFGIVPNLSGVVAIGVGTSFSAIKNDGTVVVWGESLTQNSPIPVSGVSASTVDLRGDTAVFTISQGAPLITPGQTLTGVVADLFNRTPALTNAENRPATSWSATGLPSWASINSSTGAITGTPPDFGASTITVTATGPGGSSSESVVLDINLGRPALPAGQIFSGRIGQYQDSQYPLAEDLQRRPISSWAISGRLPFGLQINSSTGEITGTPGVPANFQGSIDTGKTPIDIGSYGITISAFGPGGNTSVEAIFLLQEGRPIILPTSDAAEVGVNFSSSPFLSDANNRPATSWSAINLPSWATFSPTTGEITGTPQDTGVFKIGIRAAGPGGESIASTGLLAPYTENSITVFAGAPIITPGQNFIGKVGVLFSETPTLEDALDRPVNSWSIVSGSSLPEELTLNSSTGQITGTPTKKGNFSTFFIAEGPSTIFGSNRSQETSVSFTIADGVPIITAGQTFQGTVGTPFSATPALTNSANRPASSWSATGLPAGLSINSSTGQITGTPAAEGTTTATITVTGPGGSSTQTIAFTVLYAFPIFRGSTRATAIYAGATEGKALYYGPQLLWNVPGWEPSTLQNNLLAFYRFNAAGGGDLSLADTSGNNRTLTNTGGVSLGTGIISGAASFQSTRYLSGPIPFNTAQDWAISFWANISTLKNYFTLIGGESLGRLHIHGDATGRLYLNNGFSDVSVPNFFIAGQWDHYAFSRSGSTLSVYKNSTLVNTYNLTATYTQTSTLYIGRIIFTGDDFQFVGQMDALGLWSRALTSAEIAQLYNNGAGMEI